MYTFIKIMIAVSFDESHVWFFDSSEKSHCTVFMKNFDFSYPNFVFSTLQHQQPERKLKIILIKVVKHIPESCNVFILFFEWILMSEKKI